MKPYHEENGVTIYHGDCREVLSALPECSVDSCVTDPPYDLTANKKGGTGEASVNLNSPYGRARLTTGFMGKRWDGTGVAFDSETWKAVLRVLKPGAHLLAFGGTRTYHRMVCAIEDAGFEIRDDIDFWYDANPVFAKFYDSLNDKQRAQLHQTTGAPHLSWVFGSGFPKSLNLGNGVGTALKPAHEPVVLARRPPESTSTENYKTHGTGGLNIDACRVQGADGDGHWSGDDGSDRTSCPGYEGGFTQGGKKADGRWPANLIHDGSDEIVNAFPSAPGALYPVKGTEAGKEGTVAYGDFSGHRLPMEPRLDSGSAARFFYCAKASVADREEGLESLPARQRDDSRKEGDPGGDNPRNRGLRLRKNHHPTVKSTELMRYLVRLVTPPSGVVLDCFCGSGSTGKAAVIEGFNAILIDSEEEYCEIAKLRSRLTQPSFL